MRVLLLNVALIAGFGVLSPSSQAQVRKSEPVPVLLGKNRGALKHVKGAPRNDPAHRPRIYELDVDTDAYDWGVVDFEFKLGDGQCRAHFGVSKDYREKGVAIRGPLAPGSNIRTGSRYNIYDFKPKNKIYVYVTVAYSYIPMFDAGCTNTFEFSAYLKNYQRYVPPAPYAGTLGGADYYDFRHKDFLKRNPGRTPPNYYKQFGEKYFNRFVKEVSPTLSARGQKFLKDVAKALQQKLEDKLTADPRKFAGLERTPGDFQSFAYFTHPDAYCESGWKSLSESDRDKIIRAIDWADKYGSVRGLVTGAKISSRCGSFLDALP